MTTPTRSPSPLITLVTLILVGGLIIAGIVLVLQTRPVPVEMVIRPPLPTSTAAPTGTPGPILVYVTGAVNKPETTVSLPAGSRVEEALEAAGGTTEDADVTRVNMAASLHDGDQVHVPSLVPAATTEADATQEVVLATPSGGAKVYINTATLDELQTLPGVGEVVAQRIIDYREANGPFTSLEQLDEVNGIGPALLEKIGPLVVFE
jgi:competence protein ComEA